MAAVPSVRAARTTRTARAARVDAPPAPRPTLRVVRAPRRRHTVLWLVATIAMLAGSVLGAVSLNALAAADSVAARRLEAEVVDAERAHARLIAEVAHLDAPERVRLVATTELGMVEAPPPRYVVLGRSLPSDQAGVRAPEGDPLKPVLAAER